ncbi:hypothetical protein JZ785_21920 [Alicyclobacillus curvatus]|nr:hypothetical protein JZ785_21920 [Alicyclobacillus curvatus]
MKTSRVISGVAGLAIALTVSWPAGPVFAATTKTVKPAQPAHHLSTKSIYFNNKLVSKPAGFVVGQTTYMPVWYVMHALDAASIVNQWGGTTWKITTPKGLTPDLSKLVVGTGNIAIYIDGKLVKKVDGIIDIDPSTGKPTTYMPVWYVMDILSRLQVKSNWNGQSWTMTPAPVSKPGGSTSGGSGAGGSTGGSTPPPPPPPPVDTAPQASTLPGMVSKGQMVSDLANALGLTPSSLPATSPFDDLPVTSPYFTGDEAAMQAGLASPFFTSTNAATPSHFGAGDVVTLQDAEQFYWNYLNIQHPSFEPGGTMAAWASIIGLTQGLQQNGPYLSTADEQQLLLNLKGLLAGMVLNQTTGSGSTGNTGTTVGTSPVQMRYTPEDEYLWTFSGAVDGNGYPVYSGSSVQTAITNTYAFYNNITMQVVGGDLQVTIPVNADQRWFGYVRSQNGIQYSTDGGATWTSAEYFDGSTSTATGSVIVRAPLADGMSITYNNMVASVGGSIVLGWVNLSQSATGGITVERVTLT